MDVGYLPDMFGHVAQMPQILRQAGFDHAVVWRGVPSAVDRTAFVWQAPDGSTVRAEYLARRLRQRRRPARRRQGAGPAAARASTRSSARSWPPDAAPADERHRPPAPQPWLGRVVAEANASQATIELRDHLPRRLPGRRPDRGPAPWAGELRSGARANLLMGVASNRVDVQAGRGPGRAGARAAGRTPLRPVAAGRPTGRALLDVAWRHVIRNSAHDSVCACSVDEVVDAVLHRYAEARQIGEGLTAQALAVARRAPWRRPDRWSSTLGP